MEVFEADASNGHGCILEPPTMAELLCEGGLLGLPELLLPGGLAIPGPPELLEPQELLELPELPELLGLLESSPGQMVFSESSPGLLIENNDVMSPTDIQSERAATSAPPHRSVRSKLSSELLQQYCEWSTRGNKLQQDLQRFLSTSASLAETLNKPNPIGFLVRAMTEAMSGVDTLHRYVDTRVHSTHAETHH